MDEAAFMRRAIALSCQGVEEGGGPFGAVVVRDGRILGEGRNAVVPNRDPTAHAEIVAIRAACAAIGTHDLSGAVIYTSCEPCPMCLGAVWWARIREIVYANDRIGAAAIGFDDAAIYEEVAAPLATRRLPLRRFMAEEARIAFRAWEAKVDKVPY
ncbi:nucleoside deaminase [Neoroseomonas soli]|uniref:Nucleoside deaminase n=1 Tax=Neoroseomonas soli TaxID=1081025 RepID=A0A9X9X2D5_9PROT|nr:nucleoside deaminase [Neoroseomonas soli]MBR0673564.1 nucleoside deaminase [Neoroseomonas soli]